MTVGEKMSNFACQFSTTFSQLYNTDKIPPQFPQCTCTLPNGTLSVEGEWHLENNNPVKKKPDKSALSHLCMKTMSIIDYISLIDVLFVVLI